jgi:hypothetical protein
MADEKINLMKNHFILSRAGTFALFVVVAPLLVTGCAHNQFLSTGDSSAAVAQMLDQVNDAIIDAKANGKAAVDAPEIISVEVDLQLATSTSTDAGFPLGLIFPTGKSSSDRLHKVSLTFTPKPTDSTQAASKHNPALTSAIEKIYQSVAQANEHYQFQKGSMQIQCTLEAGVGISTSGGGGGGSSSGSSSSGGGSGDSSRQPQAASSAAVNPAVLLMPIQFDASATNESVQTITLTFGPRSEAQAKAPSTAEAPGKSGPK